MNIEYRKHTPSDVENDTGFWETLHNCFPPDEIEPDDILIKSADPKNGIVLVAQENNSTVGIVVGNHLFATRAEFMVYLAVKESHRNKGIGTELGNKLKNGGAEIIAQKTNESPNGLVWEVEDPDEADIGTNIIQERNDRIQFFTNTFDGKMTNILGYQQPSLTTEQQPVPFLLMAKTENGHTLGNDTDSETLLVPSDKRIALITDIYRTKYLGINAIPLELLNHSMQEMGLADL